MNKTARNLAVLWLGVLVLAAVLAGCAQAGACPGGTTLSSEALQACVSAAGVRTHLLALAEIAARNDGNRAAGTPGYDASVAYVTRVLEDAGYEVIQQPFEFLYEPAQSLRLVAPEAQNLPSGRVQGSGHGTVSGPVFAVGAGTGKDGCAIEDFYCCDLSGPADIALVEAGGCLSAVKAANAQQAGAEAMVIQVEGLLIDPLLTVQSVSLLPDATASGVTIPVVATGADGARALSEPGRQAAVEVPEAQLLTQHNVLAELPGLSGEKVVMAGAHLDSVPTAPGLSDNGSGSAALLETAVQMAGMKPRNTVRFAWWAAEEAGLKGSSAYVEGLSDAEREAIDLYLNFDMIASPNAALFVYDGDRPGNPDSSESPPGSAELVALFTSYYDDRDLPYETTFMERGSDFVPFRSAGIPVGAIFTGAEEHMSDEQALRFGGQAGQAFDPCYHLPCDSIDNINSAMLEINSDALAYAVYHCAAAE